MAEDFLIKWNRFRNELIRFLLALVTWTAALITGGLVAAGVGIYFAFGRTLPGWAVWALINMAFMSAAFLEYREQSRFAEVKQKQIESLQTKHLVEIRTLKEELQVLQDRRVKKDRLGTVLSALHNRWMEAKLISRIGFSDELKKKEWDTTHTLLKAIESLIEINFGMAEVALFNGGRPEPVPLADNTFASENIREWQWHVNVLSVRYDELKKIVERL